MEQTDKNLVKFIVLIIIFIVVIIVVLSVVMLKYRIYKQDM